MKAGDFLKTALIVLKSMTEAGKARHHLEKFKINAVIEKITLNTRGRKSAVGGCGYGVRVKEDPDKVCRLLGLVNIDCLEIRMV